MADQLTSVRVPQEQLEVLREIAAAHGNSVAGEIRNAIGVYIESVLGSDAFKEQVLERKAKRDEAIEQLLARANSR